MNFRTRLSLFALEERENPSGPSLIDPVGGTAPPPTAPATVASNPTALAAAAAAAAAAGAGTTTTTNPLLGTNGVYNVPLLP